MDTTAHEEFTSKRGVNLLETGGIRVSLFRLLLSNKAKMVYTFY